MPHPGAYRPPPVTVRPLPPRGNQFWHRGQIGRIHGPAFAYPPGWRYRQWTIGARLPNLLFAPNYFYPGWASLGLRRRCPATPGSASGRTCCWSTSAPARWRTWSTGCSINPERVPIAATHEVEASDLEYRREPSGPLLARLYRPRGAGPFPALLDVHGGAWTSGDRLNNAPLDAALAGSGIVVLAIISGCRRSTAIRRRSPTFTSPPAG